MLDNADHSIEIFAHRGGSKDPDVHIDENTQEAVDYTASLSDVTLETDVRLTKDGEVVLQHDAYVERTWDGSGLIHELTWAEFKKMRSRHQGTPVRLDDVLGRYPNLRLNVDAKSPNVVDPLGRLIVDHGAEDRVRVASFSHRRLRQIRRNFGISTSLSPYEVLLLKATSRLYNRMIRSVSDLLDADAAQVPIFYKGRKVVTPQFIDAAHECGVKVHVWTVNKLEEMKHLAELRVDGIITDAPQVARRVMREGHLDWRDNGLGS